MVATFPVAMVGVTTCGGGTILGPGDTLTDVETPPISVLGDLVAAHAPFTGLHLAAIIIQGSTTTFAHGRPIVYEGCVANCGHLVDVGTGDPITLVSP